MEVLEKNSGIFSSSCRFGHVAVAGPGFSLYCGWFILISFPRKHVLVRKIAGKSAVLEISTGY
jgi:hypothetical protein